MPSVLIKSRDVEAALQQDLEGLLGTALSLDVIAPPIPDDFPAGGLPLAVVERLGGSRTDILVEEHDVAIDGAPLLIKSPTGRLSHKKATLIDWRG